VTHDLVLPDTQMFPHLARFYNYNPWLHSYRGRSLALSTLSISHLATKNTGMFNVPALVKRQPLYFLF